MDALPPVTNATSPWQSPNPYKQSGSYQCEPISLETLAMIEKAVSNTRQGIVGNPFNPDKFRSLLEEDEEE
ncbi:MAG: hypothetical protein BWK78_04195 [Thiotrichaceae bacterium IS1]|nr:MAG: hypothetical protein BWK78_04195 [Thiotrichaceae bacterium IS1]